MDKDLIEYDSVKAHIESLDFHEKVEEINKIRAFLHGLSPFKGNPVDFVEWVSSDNIKSNDYNPNSVAPPEMELLELSIINDGYTQPIVGWKNDNMVEVVDGFHRNRVGKESKIVSHKIKGYLPVVNIRNEQSGKRDRIASTIRHNRARGKHQIDAMSEIVIDLKGRNWRNKRIAKELGMDEEEVLRLCQISGLEELFSDDDFSSAWVSDEETGEYEVISSDLDDDVISSFRTANTSDENRIFHTYDKWECHKAGFFNTKKDGSTEAECKESFKAIMRDIPRFSGYLNAVINEWKFSCEHYLTNKAMNRIAWLGQSAVCYGDSIPSKYSGAWFDLTDEEQNAANEAALAALNKWQSTNGIDNIGMREALSVGRQVDIY